MGNKKRLQWHDYLCLCFVKVELILSEKAAYDPRLIWGRTDAFNVKLGPPILGFSKTLSSLWGPEHSRYILYTSGCSAEDIATFTMRAIDSFGTLTVNFVTADMSRMDASFNEDCLKFEDKLFQRFGLDSEALRYLKGNHVKFGRSPNGMFFYRPDGRGTGEPHTSSMNSAVNALINMYVYDHFGVPDDVYCVIQGDDSFIITTERNTQIVTEQLYVSTWAEFGFKMKFYKCSNKLTDHDYCSRLWWPTPSHPFGYVLAPMPGKILGKVGFALNKPKCIYTHYKGVALGLARDCGHVPFLRVLVKHLLRITEAYDAPESRNDYAINSDSTCEFSDRSFELCLERYGLGEAYENELDQALATVQSLPWSLNLGWVDQLISVDAMGLNGIWELFE